MINEYDRIILNADLPEAGLEKGDIGTVVATYNNGQGFEVEFMTLDGTTITVATLSNAQVREIKKREIAHVRDLSMLKNAV